MEWSLIPIKEDLVITINDHAAVVPMDTSCQTDWYCTLYDSHLGKIINIVSSPASGKHLLTLEKLISGRWGDRGVNDNFTLVTVSD